MYNFIISHLKTKAIQKYLDDKNIFVLLVDFWVVQCYYYLKKKTAYALKNFGKESRR